MTHTPRLNPYRAAPEGYKALIAVETYLASSSLDHTLIHLVKLRASQINACGYCIDMHWKDARAAGETEQRLYGLDAWRESPYYSERERAALEWTESLTRLSETGAPDEHFAAARAQFSDRELADLTLAVGMINTWNRIAVGLRSTPGSYRPAAHSAATPPRSPDPASPPGA